ncbi:hypothetical protein B0H10DRAFT_2321053 [Mycena sp. CBHHK59/15]|nr:hypothetical protein B0H10DRAFT_2321053 [Mycena sp. CBHHK59/15]
MLEGILLLELPDNLKVRRAVHLYISHLTRLEDCLFRLYLRIDIGLEIGDPDLGFKIIQVSANAIPHATGAGGTRKPSFRPIGLNSNGDLRRFKSSERNLLGICRVRLSEFEPDSCAQCAALEENVQEFGVTYFGMRDKRQNKEHCCLSARLAPRHRKWHLLNPAMAAAAPMMAKQTDVSKLMGAIADTNIAAPGVECF